LGVIIAGVITILIGLSGIGPIIAKLFTTGVMGVFMFLLGLTLFQIFLLGMLGIPFGVAEEAEIRLYVAALVIFIVLIYVFIRINIVSNCFAGNSLYFYWRCIRVSNKITCCVVRNFYCTNCYDY